MGGWVVFALIAGLAGATLGVLAAALFSAASRADERAEAHERNTRGRYN